MTDPHEAQHGDEDDLAPTAEVDQHPKQVRVVYRPVAIDISATEIAARSPEVEQHAQQISIIYTAVVIHIAIVRLATRWFNIDGERQPDRPALAIIEVELPLERPCPVTRSKRRARVIQVVSIVVSKQVTYSWKDTHLPSKRRRVSKDVCGVSFPNAHVPVAHQLSIIRSARAFHIKIRVVEQIHGDRVADRVCDRYLCEDYGLVIACVGQCVAQFDSQRTLAVSEQGSVRLWLIECRQVRQSVLTGEVDSWVA